MHGSVIHYIAMLESGHLSHPGLRRDLNEDTYYGDGKLNLWLVADGIGGHDCGEIASALAREVTYGKYVLVRHSPKQFT